MEQLLPIIYEDKVSQEEIAKSLNVTTDIFHEHLPIKIISTGLKDIFIPIKKVEQLQVIQPNYELITSISHKLNVIGYHLFSIMEDQHYIARCRNFAPAVNILEENATGTSSGALASYLFTYGIRPHNLRYYFQQGSSAVGTGYIEAVIEADANNISSVQVGGTARFVDKIEVNIS
ncbi:putative isomerase YddE [compost metagenome]